MRKLSESWSRRWQVYWFRPSTGIALGVSRILVAGAQLFVFFPSLGRQLGYLRSGYGFIEPQALMTLLSSLLPSGTFPAESSLTLVYWITAASGILTVAGLLTRSSALVFAAGNWILVTHQYSYGEKHHPEALLCIFLLLLGLSPSGHRLSVDAWLRKKRQARTGSSLANDDSLVWNGIWPLKLMQVLLSLAYFSGGVCKLIFGGFPWFNGYTLQQHMFADAIRENLLLGQYMAQFHYLCIALSIFIVAIELFWPVTLFIPRSIPLFLLGGVLLHLGIYVTMGAPFFQFLVLYIVYLDPDRWSLLRVALGHKKCESSLGHPDQAQPSAVS